jgi:thiol-disulfide isomerase/thioredoxin
MTSPDRTTRTLRAAGALLVALVGMWAGARVYTSRSSHTPNETMRTAVGEASPATPSDAQPAFDTPTPSSVKIPEVLPEFSLPDRAGDTTSIARWAGKSLVLNFWATWCAPCRREIPLLETLSREWSGRNLEVIGIAVDYREKVLAYANELKIPYALLIGEQEALDVAVKFGVDTPVFPFTVFTDNRGQVVTLYLGELHRPQADLILAVVQRLNGKQLELDQARRDIAEGLEALQSKRSG